MEENNYAIVLSYSVTIIQTKLAFADGLIHLQGELAPFQSFNLSLKFQTHPECFLEPIYSRTVRNTTAVWFLKQN